MHTSRRHYLAANLRHRARHSQRVARGVLADQAGEQ
jgi:hypothetical protein